MKRHVRISTRAEHARLLLSLMLAAPAAAFGFSAFRASSYTLASPYSERAYAFAATGATRQGFGSWHTAASTRRRRSSGSSHHHHHHQRGVRMMSYEGGDFPSDVGDSAGSSAVPVVLADDNPELRETMKREILQIAATSNRYKKDAGPKNACTYHTYIGTYAPRGHSKTRNAFCVMQARLESCMYMVSRLCGYPPLANHAQKTFRPGIVFYRIKRAYNSSQHTSFNVAYLLCVRGVFEGLRCPVLRKEGKAGGERRGFVCRHTLSATPIKSVPCVVRFLCKKNVRFLDIISARVNLDKSHVRKFSLLY